MDELIRELKAEGVLKSPYVEAAFRAIDRKDFVRPEFLSEAYGNYPLPIGEGQTISQPYTVAFLLDLLDPKPGERILDIGSGSGWTTALLAYIVSRADSGERIADRGRVYAIERIPELCRFGERNAAKYDFVKRGIAEFVCVDGSLGLPSAAPFDKILASATAAAEIPQPWRDALAVGGVIVAPVGSSVWRFVKKSETEWEETEYPGFAFVPLVRDEKREKGNPEKEKCFRLFLLFLFFFLLILGYGAYAVFMPLKLPGERVGIEIPSGAGGRAIARELKSKGVIRSSWVFTTYAALIGKNHLLKPGSYDFGLEVSIAEIVQRLVRGPETELVITIPEGWDLRDIGFYFERLGLFPAEEWWAAAGFPAQDYRRKSALPPPEDFSREFFFLADRPRNAGLEGYLYPDTYRIFKKTSPAEVARKMLANFDRKLTPELRAEIRRQGKTIFEVITLASLLESEVASIPDRRLISGILWKRLSLGIPLQVDASVNYASGKRETPSAEDLTIASPYNTYRSPGFPLGPISNPSLDSIRAALQPQASPYLYYLSAPDGRTIYSETLKEHSEARATYLRPVRNSR